MDLSKLDFGAPAAERDVLLGLKSYFFESESYKRFKEGRRTILLGNRGAGKSAIFKILAANYRLSGYQVIELTPEDYSYEMLSRTLTKEAKGSWAKQGAFTAAWKYLIYILAMGKVLEKSPSLKKKEARDIYNFLRDHHKGFQNNPLEILVSYLKRLESIKLGFFDASIKVRELQTLYKLEEISRLLPILEDVCRRTPVVVFIDELDRGWDASEDAQAFVAGLFQAAMSINETMKNFRVLISLRQELYDNIPSLYEDAQKVWDLIEVIKWDKTSLLNLMAKRIEYSFPELGKSLPEEWWRAVFTRKFDQGRFYSFDYLIARTLYRPREIIQFCTQAKERAITSGKVPINYDTITEVECAYSENRTKDIAAEYRFQFPGLGSVFEAFRGRTCLFERDELEDLCLRIILREITTSEETKKWLDDQEPDFLLNMLWHVGFLRAQTPGDGKSNKNENDFYGPYQIASLNLRNINKFDVHPMFRTYLGLEEPTQNSTST